MRTYFDAAEFWKTVPIVAVRAAAQPYRAAYWTNGQAEVGLTTRAQADLSERDLLESAYEQARREGLALANGRIVVGFYRD